MEQYIPLSFKCEPSSRILENQYVHIISVNKEFDEYTLLKKPGASWAISLQPNKSRAVIEEHTAAAFFHSQTAVVCYVSDIYVSW